MVFRTAVGPAELAEVRRRIDRPAMVIDMPGRKLEAHQGASIVLYYAFSVLVQYEALSAALRAFRGGARPGGQPALEGFLSLKPERSETAPAAATPANRGDGPVRHRR